MTPRCYPDVQNVFHYAEDEKKYEKPDIEKA
jgi:hypothetical protein